MIRPRPARFREALDIEIAKEAEGSMRQSSNPAWTSLPASKKPHGALSTEVKAMTEGLPRV